MLTNSDTVNGLPVRAEIRIPRAEGGGAWPTSVVVCQDLSKSTYVVWSVWHENGIRRVENGIYDLAPYGRALERAFSRAANAAA